MKNDEFRNSHRVPPEQLKELTLGNDTASDAGRTPRTVSVIPSQGVPTQRAAGLPESADYYFRNEEAWADKVRRVEDYYANFVPAGTFSILRVFPTTVIVGHEITVYVRMPSHVVPDSWYIKFAFRRKSDGVFQYGLIVSQSSGTFAGHPCTVCKVEVPEFTSHGLQFDAELIMEQVAPGKVFPPPGGSGGSPEQGPPIPIRESQPKAISWTTGPPVIRSFTANYKECKVVVQPGSGVIRFGFIVSYVTQLKLKRISPQGPAANFTYHFQPDEKVNTYQNLPGFTELSPTDAEYELTAINDFGTVKKQVRVLLRQIPDLKIVGVEVVQAIQQFGFGPAAASTNNSVPGVTNKLTMVRVYLDSGIQSGFDNGVGADLQPNVTGSLRVIGNNTGQHNASPINGGGTITAGRLTDISRSNLDHSLNFIVPPDALSPANVNESVELQFDVKIWVESDVDGIPHEHDIGFSFFVDMNNSVTKTFVPRAHRRVVRIRVGDEVHNLPWPTNADYNAALHGATIRFPIADNGFEIRIPNTEIIATSRDLSQSSGWEDLLDDIEDIADDYDAPGELWTALVPNSPNYAVNGAAVGRCMASRSGLPATFAHELGHLFGFGHAPCGVSTDLDPYLPGLIDQVGVDVPGRVAYPVGTGEIMSYCSGQNRWPSIVFWNRAFVLLSF